MKSLVLAVVCLSAVGSVFAGNFNPIVLSSGCVSKTEIFVLVPPSDGLCDYRQGRFARLQAFDTVVPADWKRCKNKFGHKSPHKFE